MTDESNNVVEQTIPGVRVAPPSSNPVDATGGDVGAANASIQQPANAQNMSVSITSLAQNNTNLSNNNIGGHDANISISESVEVDDVKKGKKKKNIGIKFLLFIVILLIGALFFFWKYHEQQMGVMVEKCTPVSTSSEAKKLDLNSTIVRDLYSKVYTNIKEDLGQSEFNDELKLYLAYRQIPASSFYDSNCNLFTVAGIEPFVCEETATFTPKAFKKDTLQLEVKKLFGEDINIPDQNIQLGNSCVGGYKYIEERGEYVQGLCKTNAANMYRVSKKLIEATSRESVIVLRENVKYYGSEGVSLPERLVSGVYEYTFKLDVNYNYVYVSKTLVVE